MVASPKNISTPGTGHQREADYTLELHEFSLSTLTELVQPSFAQLINISAAKDEDILKLKLPERVRVARFNTGLYDDEVEDFIVNETMDKLLEERRRFDTHESAERVRLLRSARAVIYLTSPDAN